MIIAERAEAHNELPAKNSVLTPKSPLLFTLTPTFLLARVSKDRYYLYNSKLAEIPGCSQGLERRNRHAKTDFFDDHAYAFAHPCRYNRTGGSENTEDNRNEPSSEVMSFTITDVVKDENAIGRCAAPAGYTTAYQTYICTYSQSAMNPCMAYITSYREDGPEKRCGPVPCLQGRTRWGSRGSTR